MGATMLLSFVGLCAIAVNALPASSSLHVLHEKRDSLSSAWVKADRVHGDVKLPMRIGLTQSNLDQAHDLLLQVSDPGSARYAQHYTAEEVADIFAPAKEAVDAVSAWLHSAGIHASRLSQSANKQWLQFDATTAEAEELLQTKYHFYEHLSTGKNNIACDEYVSDSPFPRIQLTRHSQIPRSRARQASHRLRYSGPEATRWEVHVQQE